MSNKENRCEDMDIYQWFGQRIKTNRDKILIFGPPSDEWIEAFGSCNHYVFDDLLELKAHLYQ